MQCYSTKLPYYSILLYLPYALGGGSGGGIRTRGESEVMGTAAGVAEAAGKGVPRARLGKAAPGAGYVSLPGAAAAGGGATERKGTNESGLLVLLWCLLPGLLWLESPRLPLLLLVLPLRLLTSLAPLSQFFNISSAACIDLRVTLASALCPTGRVGTPGYRGRPRRGSRWCCGSDSSRDGPGDRGSIVGEMLDTGELLHRRREILAHVTCHSMRHSHREAWVWADKYINGSNI
jgi:hypothetical protein